MNVQFPPATQLTLWFQGTNDLAKDLFGLNLGMKSFVYLFLIHKKMVANDQLNTNLTLV